MRTIHLRQNKTGAWFVNVTSGGDIVSTTEAYDAPAGAARAFISEGRNQPFASMVVHKPGQAKPVRVRSGRPMLQDPARAIAPTVVSAAMKR